MPWHPLEHEVWKALKRHGLENKNDLLLAVSGGLDSMVLLEVILNLKPQASVTVATFHHGLSNDLATFEFRNKAVEVVRNRCVGVAQVRFITEQASKPLNSENDFRLARWQFLNQIRQSSHILLTAHHLDDWVETLTLKMIRGVGVEGFTAFQMWDQNIFRPFLDTKKEVLKSYAIEKELDWVDDPSNKEDHYLRNWLREVWFKILDEKNPSGYENYSRSLLRLVQELDQKEEFLVRFYADDFHAGIDRKWYLGLSEKDQLRALSIYMRRHGIPDVSQGKIAEIQKRLDKTQKELTFIIGKINWVINEKQIMLGF